MDDLARFAILFGLMLVGWILAGFVEARISTRHPKTHETLGTLFLLHPSIPKNVSHDFKWSRFFLYGHFRCGDGVLSALCLGVTAIQILFFGALFAVF